MSKNVLKCLTQKLDNKVLDLGKQKQFCPFEYISNFENLSIVLAKKSFIVRCMIKNSDKE